MAQAPSLADLQALFQAAILSGDRTVLGFIPEPPRTSAETLLGVYTKGYRTRLTGVVKSDHPVLAAYAGETRFAELVQGYLSKHSSRSPNARWVSDLFPQYLRESASDAPELAEIADFERALNLAFDAPDVPILDLAGLAALAPPEHWGGLSFIMHPSAQLLPFATNGYEIWRAVRANETPPLAALREALSHVLVSRRADGVVQREISPEEAMMWRETARGASFGAVCELLAVFDDPETAPARAAQYLAGWLESGVFTRALLAHAPNTV